MTLDFPFYGNMVLDKLRDILLDAGQSSEKGRQI